MKVFLDTNVLFDYLQCDMFLTVAETKWMDLDMFWSDYVLAELREHLTDRMTETDPDHDRRQSELLVDKRIRAMGKAFPHATITGWERKLSAARCFVHDSDDAPILAATLQADCRYLVTSNLKDFAIDELKSALNVSVLNTGMMFDILHTWDRNGTERALRLMLSRHREPPTTFDQLTDRLAATPETQVFAQKLQHAPSPSENQPYRNGGPQPRDAKGRFARKPGYDGNLEY